MITTQLENCKSIEEYVNKIFETEAEQNRIAALDRIGFDDEWKCIAFSRPSR